VKAVKETGPAEAEKALRGYQWSSYPGYASLKRRKPFVDYSEILAYVGGDTARGRKQYIDFVREGITTAVKNPFQEVVAQLILGSEEFVERLKEQLLSDSEASREMPSMRHLSVVRKPEQVLAAVAAALECDIEELTRRGKRSPERGMAMELVHRLCGLSQPEIGKLFGGLDYSSVSVNRKKFLSALDHDKHLRQAYLETLEKLKNQE
jgi:chromosomal replication initiation ATPase DnaA